jgi:hypothetical protein
VDALHRLGEQGTTEHIGLLRSLSEHERAEVSSIAAEAMSTIRERQRRDQRERFALSLPDWPELANASREYVTRGVGREEAACVAYSALLLHPEEPRYPAHAESGDAEQLLAGGRPRQALSAALAVEREGVAREGESRWLQARAYEDLGEVRSAIRMYAILAAGGDEKAKAALDGYGVDTERILLGILAFPDFSDEADATPAQVLEVLVRHGDDLTVTVLAERTRSAAASDQATAADALARMLEGSARSHPLGVAVQHDARSALARVSREGPEPLREIAEAALKEHSGER